MAEMGWLILFLMILRGGNALGAADLSLDVPHTVSGVRRGSVVIPCTYSPSSEYTQSEVSWYYSSSLFFHRYDSEDHVVLTRYRDRVTVSNSRPGDVSLTLSNLEIMDRGRFMCKVKWRAKTDGTRVTKEGSSSLNVLRENPVTQKPDVEVTTSASTIKTRNPITKKPDVRVVNTKAPATKTGTSQNAAVPTVRKIGAMKSSQPTQETSNKQHSTGAESTLSTHTTAHHARPDGLGAAADSGVPHYILILTGVIFALSVLTLALVLVTRRKRKRDQSYGVPTMRQLAVMLDGAPVPSGGCQPCASQSPRAENIYQPCKEQPENEYQPCKEQPENEYQPLKAWDDNEYELLVPERGGSI